MDFLGGDDVDDGKQAFANQLDLEWLTDRACDDALSNELFCFGRSH